VAILRELAKSDSATLRERVARNIHVPNDILRYLIKDEEYWVREHVTLNSNSSILVMLFEYKKSLTL